MHTHIATSFTEIKFIFRHFRCINNNDDLYDVLGSSPFLYTLYVLSRALLSPHYTFFLPVLFSASFICLFGFGRLAPYTLVRSLVHSLACEFVLWANIHSFAWHSSTTRETSQSLDAKMYECAHTHTLYYIWQNMNGPIVCASELTTAIMNFMCA